MKQSPIELFTTPSYDRSQQKFVQLLPPPSSMHHYFDRDIWAAAVCADDANMFRAKRVKQPVKEAGSLVDKIRLKPELGPFVDWCAAWLRNAHEHDRLTSGPLKAAFEAAQEAAAADAVATRTPTRAPFQLKWRSTCNNCGLQFRMLLEYAATDGAAVPARSTEST